MSVGASYGVQNAIGLNVKPKIQVMYNFTGDTLVEGDCVVADMTGTSSGVNWSANYDDPTHPFSRVVDITTLLAGAAITGQNFGQSMVYIGRYGAYDGKSLPNTMPGLFLVQGHTRKVKTFVETGTFALFTAGSALWYGWPADASLTDKQLEVIGTAAERVLFIPSGPLVTTENAAVLRPGLFLGDIGVGFGRTH